MGGGGTKKTNKLVALLGLFPWHWDKLRVGKLIIEGGLASSWLILSLRTLKWEIEE